MKNTIPLFYREREREGGGGGGQLVCICKQSLVQQNVVDIPSVSKEGKYSTIKYITYFS